MNPDVQRDIMRRLAELERTAVRYRAGEVTDASPLTVALGGSNVAHDDVRAVVPGAALAGQVATLVFGSDLLVLGQITDTPLRIVRGAVSTAGATLEGSGFTPTRNGTGDYTITFSTAFADIPAFVATPVAATGRFVAMDNAAPTASAVRIVTRNSAGTATDTEFHFIAVGPG